MSSTCFDHASEAEAPRDILASVRRRLSAAPAFDDIDRYLGALHWTDVIARMDARPLVEEVPDLADRFRGALGRALEQMQGHAPEAWALLFGPQIVQKNGATVRPYALAADRQGDEILCRVRLFGFADCWAPEIAAGLAMAAERGIALRSHGRQRIRFPLRSVEGSVCRWFEAQPARRNADVILKTPLLIRHGDHVAGSLDRLQAAAVRRLEGVLTWCDATPATGITAAFLMPLWSIAGDRTTTIGWTRHSATHPGGRDHVGFVGRFRLTSVTPLGHRVLQAGEICHIGGGVTAGHGAIVVSPW